MIGHKSEDAFAQVVELLRPAPDSVDHGKANLAKAYPLLELLRDNYAGDRSDSSVERRYRAAYTLVVLYKLYFNLRDAVPESCDLPDADPTGTE